MVKLTGSVAKLVALAFATVLCALVCLMWQAGNQPSRVPNTPEVQRNPVPYGEMILIAHSDCFRPVILACADALATMEERSLPALERILDETESRKAMVFFDVIARMSYYLGQRAADEGAFPAEPEDGTSLPWLRPVLNKALRHPAPLVRQWALIHLSYHCPENAAWFLDATTDPAAKVRSAAFRLLQDLPAAPRNKVREAVHGGLADAIPTVRAVAILTAARLRIEGALPRLLALLDDSAEAITGRWFVPAELIWQEPPRRTTDPGGSIEPRVNELAAHAIQEITGKDFGFRACFESRNKMPEIIARIRKELAESEVGARQKAPQFCSSGDIIRI